MGIFLVKDEYTDEHGTLVGGGTSLRAQALGVTFTAASGVAVGWGAGTTTPPITSMETVFGTDTRSQAMTFTLNRTATLDTVTFALAADDVPGTTFMSVNIQFESQFGPAGSVQGTTGPFSVPATAGIHTVSFTTPIEVEANRAYYVRFDSEGSGSSRADIGRLGGTNRTGTHAGYGDLIATYATDWFIGLNAMPYDQAIWFKLTYNSLAPAPTPNDSGGGTVTTSNVSWTTHTPVALGAAKVLMMTHKSLPAPPMATHRLKVVSSQDAPTGNMARIYTLTDTGWTRSDPTHLPWTSDYNKACATTLEGHVVTYADDAHLNLIGIGTDGTMTPLVGPSYAVGGTGQVHTAPDSMTRLPGANAFLSWLYYPTIAHAGLVLFGVVGTSIQSKSSISVNFVAYDAPDVPRQIIPISDSEAISAVMMPSGKIQLFHISFTGGLINYQTQDVTGYVYTPDLSLFPSTAHHAEMMVRFSSTTNELRRYGVDYNGTQFVLTAMPLTQLPTGLAPEEYHPTRSDSGVRPAVDASYLAVGGAIYVSRHYVDDGHDDNFIHLTQYDQDTGQVLDQTFSKGDQNGVAYHGNAAHRPLYISNMHLAYDDTVGELIVGATDTYTPLTSARLATFRVTYALGESRRSRSASFEP